MIQFIAQFRAHESSTHLLFSKFRMSAANAGLSHAVGEFGEFEGQLQAARRA